MNNLKKALAIFLVALTVFGVSPVIEASLPAASVVSTAQAASKVKLNKSNLFLAKGETYKLKLKGNKKKVKWSTSNKKVATVKNGKVYAKKKGSAIITAKVGKKKYKCKVTVFKHNREGGVWNCNINGEEWFFSVSEYTSEYLPYKPLGVVQIVKGSEDSQTDLAYDEYSRTGVNKYVYKYSGGEIEFTVKSNSVIVKQLSGDVDGTDISGTYTLVHRPYGG